MQRPDKNKQQKEARSRLENRACVCVCVSVSRARRPAACRPYAGRVPTAVLSVLTACWPCLLARYDVEQFSWLCFLFEVDGFHATVKLELLPNFPQECPTITLLSAYRQAKGQYQSYPPNTNSFSASDAKHME